MRKTTSLLTALLAFLLLASTAWGQYCLPTYQFACTSDDYIDDVIFAGINHVNTGCNGIAPNNYTNFSSTHTATVTINQTYPITVEPGPVFGQYFIALIDINHDNDFVDAGEFYDLGYAQGGGIVNSSITVPCGALTGPTRLRILCRYFSTPLTIADICSPNLDFGEIHDYNIVINPPAGTDGALTRFVSPVSACAMTASEQVRVRVKNLGATPINGYTVCYTLNNGAPICETVSTVIPACDSVLHTFATTANLSVTGQYDFDATLTVAGDGNLVNNSINNYYVNNIPVIGTIPYSQNFDGAPSGWLSSGTSSSWGVGAPAGTFINQPASSPNAWVTNLAGLYNPDEMSYVTSPCFNLSALTSDPYIALSRIFEMPGYDDKAYVELTTNAGATWTKVGSFFTGNNWYNNSFDDAWNGVSGNPGQWNDADHVLTGAAGSSSVRVRVAFSSDAFTEMEGFGFDNVKLLDTLRNVGVDTFLAPLSGCQLTATNAVTIQLTNYGSHAVSNIPVCFTVNNGPAVCETVPGPIAAGASVNYTFTGTANLGTIGNYALKAYANWGSDYSRLNDTTRSNVSNFAVVNTFPYRESFETNAGGWVSGGLANNDWAHGTPAKTLINSAGHGTKCWITAGLTPGTYLDNTNNWVESPCFDMASMNNPWVLMKIRHQTESNYDGAILEASTDGGNTWAQVGQYLDPFNWYNMASIWGLTQVGLSGDAWAGTSTGWLQTKHGVTNLGGQSSVRFRVHFASDGSVVYEGVAFDDFRIVEAPAVNLGPDTAICASITLAPGLTNGTYLWSNGATTSSINVTSPGTYSVVFTDSLGIPGYDTVVVSMTPTPAADLGPDKPVCTGDTTCLDLGGVSYTSTVWSTGATTSQICVNSAGVWTVEATDPLGCVSRDTINTYMVSLPTPYIGVDTTVCPGDTICLRSHCGPNHTYLWSNGSTSDVNCVFTVAPYWVQCTDANGCVARDTISITQGAAPVVGGSADTTGCPVVVFTNTSTGNGTFWNFGDGNTSTSANPTHDYTNAGNGSYTVTLITSNACGSDTLTIPINIGCLISVGDAFSNQVRLFPNPTRGMFKLETTLEGSVPVVVTIEDMHGRLVFRRDYGVTVGAFAEEFDLREPSGVYFVRMKIGDQVAVRKLVVQ